MLFNSFEFLPFLLIVYLLYWFLLNKNLKAQNIFLLAVSYFFYSCWDWRFLFLLIFSTLINYFFGLFIYKTEEQPKRQKLFLWLSIINNLAILGFFKYYNFFALSAQAGLGFLGLHVEPWLLHVLLPVGISFYTFHGMSYVFDIYNGKIEPNKNFIEYAVFVCFFPLLVAGPIERATHLLPQVKKKRVFSYRQSIEGLRLMLWGYFLKVVIADSLSVFVNDIFKNYKTYPGSMLVMGTLYFTVQVYGDFCGYTNIAIGVAKLFGFELLSNFRYPFFSKSISEFWRRWHISLASWFYDYVYYPTVAALRSWRKWAIAFGLLFTFCLSGFWHGPAWKYIFWGTMHGAAIVYEFFTAEWRKKIFGKLPLWLNHSLSMLFTFSYVVLLAVFFKADTVSQGFDYICHFGPGIFRPLSADRLGLVYVIITLLIDWMQRKSERNVLNVRNGFLRWSLYVSLFICLLIHSGYNEVPFIYFQF
jgi:alginate O-acetyltransferase complex protein AlgI